MSNEVWYCYFKNFAIQIIGLPNSYYFSYIHLRLSNNKEYIFEPDYEKFYQQYRVKKINEK